MRFQIATSKLLELLQITQAAVPSKSTLPILGNVLLEARAKELQLAATDLEMSISSLTSVESEETGSTTVPAKTFTEIIRELPETEVLVVTKDERMEISTTTGQYKISGIPADEFPRIAKYNSAKEIKIPGGDFIKMVRKTAFAVSIDESRPALNGILWQTSGDKMIMVATDGHRLAKIALENTKLRGISDDIIVPPKAVNAVVKLIGDAHKEVGVVFGEKSVMFRVGSTIISSKLFEGPYPNFDQVIPRDNDKRFVVEKESLISAVRRVSILSNSLTHQVKFSLSQNRLLLSATNVDLGGEAKEELPCEYKEEKMELGYNASYIEEILRQTDGEEVVFELSSPVSAGIVYSADRTEDYLCLIMPLRLAD
jgi:DNA polymerase-3 subunit beta